MLRKLIKLFRLAGNSTYRRGLRHGTAATVEHAAFLSSHRFRTVLDGGANKGQFALAALKHYPDAKIVSFEPLSGPAARFKRVFDGVANVTLVQAALGASDGTAEIHISKRDDSSSLLPIGDLQSEIFPGTEERAVEQIRVMRLDEAVGEDDLRAPVLLKIDVQGFELELLKGAGKILEKLDGLYVELSFLPFYEGQPLAPDVIAWLYERGFALSGVYHVAKDATGRSVQADFYFSRRPDEISPIGSQ